MVWIDHYLRILSPQQCGAVFVESSIWTSMCGALNHFDLSRLSMADFCAFLWRFTCMKICLNSLLAHSGFLINAVMMLICFYGLLFNKTIYIIIGGSNCQSMLICVRHSRSLNTPQKMFWPIYLMHDTYLMILFSSGFSSCHSKDGSRFWKNNARWIIHCHSFTSFHPFPWHPWPEVVTTLGIEYFEDGNSKHHEA